MNQDKNKKNRFSIYILISIAIHLIILFFFPIGIFQGYAGRGEDVETDFGQVHFVEIAEPQQDTQTEPADDPEPELEPEPVEETEPEPEPDPEPVEEPEPELEPVEETETDTPESEETQPDREEEDIMAAEESETEIEIEENGGEETVEESTEETEIEEEPPPPGAADTIPDGNPKPAYPKDLQADQLSGTVELKISINIHGELENIEIINSSGYDAMDQIAINTIEIAWDFNAFNDPYTVESEINFKENTDVEVEMKNLIFR